MKSGKRFVSLVLALVMICSLMVNAGATEAQEEIQAYLSYDITVTYNGEAQTMTDAAGNIVYPVSYNGTTYLPVRAVSNMLGVAVDWDGTTQTVILSDSADGRTTAKSGGAASTASGQEEIKAYLAPGITVKYNGEVQTMTDAAGNTVYPISYNGTTYLPVRAVSNMLGVAVDWDGTTQTVLLGTNAAGNSRLDTDRPSTDKNDPLKMYKTSENAEILGENHIGNNWIEIDWSTVSDSYVRVVVKNLPEGEYLRMACQVYANVDGKRVAGTRFVLSEGEWNIPLYNGNTEYAIQVSKAATVCEHYLNKEERAFWDECSCQLTARFNAEIENPDNVWLLSAPNIDFAHAPETCAKALEITANCKTDAEKITAVYNWVSQNIKYDHEEQNRMKNPENPNAGSCLFDEENGEHILPDELYGYKKQYALDLDLILEKKTGVCAHYATLMAGMLRSIGVPCKVVTGQVINNGKKTNHGWVAVNPETGTLKITGAGKDYTTGTNTQAPEPTGWIRLDPTNAKNTSFTANDKNYIVKEVA